MSLYLYSLSRFLGEVGAAFLPHVMVATSIMIILFSLFNTFWGNKMSPATRIILTLLLLITVFVILEIAHVPAQHSVFVIFLIFSFFMFFLGISMINLVHTLITPLQAKSLMPLISSFNNLGIITGSFLSAAIPHVFHVISIENFSVIALFTIILLVLIISRIFKKDIKLLSSGITAQKAPANLKKSVRFIFSESHLLKTLAFYYFLIIAIQLLTEFKLKTTLPQYYKGEELSQIISYVYLFNSSLAFIISFFFSKKLLFRFGVSNLLLSFPVILLILLSGAAITGFQPLSVILFYLAFAAPYYSYMPAASSQIFSLVPQKLRQGVYFIIVGIITSLSSLFISANLLIYSHNLPLEKTLNSAMIGVLLLCIVIALFQLKKYYFNELKENLFKEDRYLQHQAIELFAEKSNRNRGEVYLRRFLTLSNNDEQARIKAMQSLAIIGNCQSILDLIKVLKNGSPKEKFTALHAISIIIRQKKKMNEYPVTKHLLFKTYEEVFVSDAPMYIKLEVLTSLRHFDLNDVITFLEESLKNNDPQIRMNTIETFGSFRDRAIIPYLEPFLNDTDLKVVCGTIAALWQFQDIRLYLFPKISSILAQNSQLGVECSLFLIGSIGAVWEEKYVLEKFHSPVTHIHTYATLMMIQLGNNNYIHPLLNDWLKLLTEAKSKSGNAMERQLEIEFILSQYRHFSQKTKDLIILKIQQMKMTEAEIFRDAFAQSRYLFDNEIEALS